jgi:hypothetical protein
VPLGREEVQEGLADVGDGELGFCHLDSAELSIIGFGRFPPVQRGCGRAMLEGCLGENAWT